MEEKADTEEKDKPEELERKSMAEPGSKKKLLVIGVVVILIATSLAWMLFSPADTPGVGGTNEPPVVLTSWEDEGGDGEISLREIVYFNATATDPEGESLNYKWDFDDSDGILVEATSESTFHTYTEIGNKRITVNVSDGLKYTVEVIDITVKAGDIPQGTLESTSLTYIPPFGPNLHAGYNIKIASLTVSTPLNEVHYYLKNGTDNNQTLRHGTTDGIRVDTAPATGGSTANLYFVDADNDYNVSADDIYQINDLNHLLIPTFGNDIFMLVWDVLDENIGDSVIPPEAVIACIRLDGSDC